MKLNRLLLALAGGGFWYLGAILIGEHRYPGVVCCLLGGLILGILAGEASR